MPKVVDGGLDESLISKAVASQPSTPKQEAGPQIEKRVKVIIHEQEGHEGTKDVQLGVNGRVINIKRGYEVEIPEPYFKVLEDAKYEIPVKNDDGTEEIKIIPRFAYSKVA